MCSGSRRSYPSFALALSLFDEPAWEALSPERPPRAAGISSRSASRAATLTCLSDVRADEWIVNYLKGLSYLDDRLTPLLMPLALPEANIELPASQRLVADQIIDRLKRTKPSESPPPIQLLGSDAASKRFVAGFVCRAAHVHPYRLQSSALPATPADLETFARLWRRSALLLPIALYLETGGADQLGARAALASALSRFLGRANALVFIDAREPGAGFRKAAIPSMSQSPARRTEGSVGGDARPRSRRKPGTPRRPVQPEHRHDPRDSSRGRPCRPGHGRPPRSALGRLPRPHTAELETLAERIVPKATWEDIVLPSLRRHCFASLPTRSHNAIASTRTGGSTER